MQPKQKLEKSQQLHLGTQDRQIIAFSCLYTTKLTQKRKIWQDGYFEIRKSCATLRDASDAVSSSTLPLDEIDLSTSQLENLALNQNIQLHSEKHIIQIQGPWISTSNSASLSTFCAKSSTIPISHSMKKVLGSKFRKVTVGEIQPSLKKREPIWLKRNRPLQPGELERRFSETHTTNYSATSSYSRNGHQCVSENLESLPAAIEDNSRMDLNTNAKQFYGHKSLSESCFTYQGNRFVNPSMKDFKSSDSNRSGLNQMKSNDNSSSMPKSIKSDTTFANNKFDPNIYYGEESENSDPEYSNSLCISDICDIPAANESGPELYEANPETSSHRFPNRRQIQDTTTKEVLSRNELLQIFNVQREGAEITSDNFLSSGARDDPVPPDEGYEIKIAMSLPLQFESSSEDEGA
jgi:Protein of unknown function (DUF2439)